MSDELVSVAFPDSVVEIGRDLFRFCGALTTITIHPDNPAYASENGVLFNKDKTELIAYPEGRQDDYVIPDSVVKIGDSAFEDCKGLTSITIPDSVKEIGDDAFCNCKGLMSVKIHDSVVTIGFFAFRTECNTTSITIPASVIELGFHAVLGCYVTAHPDNPEYSSEDGVLFNREKTELISYPKGKHGDYVIPNSVIEIEIGAFDGCTGLTSIIIPESVTKIGENAFRGCKPYFTVHPDNPAYKSVNGRLERKCKLFFGHFNQLGW